MVTTLLNLPNPCHGNQRSLSTSATYPSFSSFPLISQFVLEGLLFLFGCLEPSSPSWMGFMGTVGQCAVCGVLPVHSGALQTVRAVRLACSWCGVVPFHLNKSMAPTDADSSKKCVLSCLVFDNIIWTQENTS